MTRRRTLLVGSQAVSGSYGDLHGTAFLLTASGENLARYAGLRDSRALLARADAVNLWRDPWQTDASDAQHRTLDLWRTVIEPGRYERVILFGVPVIRAFGLPTRPSEHGVWRTARSPWGRPLLLAGCAHPSGLTRTWNDRAYRARLSAFLTQALGEARPA